MATPTTPTTRRSRKAAAPTTPAPKAQRTRKAPAATEPTPAPAPTAPKPSRPNAERRNEATHVDGAAAVAYAACPKCKARKGTRCISQRGEPTNFVHAPRMARWDAS